MALNFWFIFLLFETVSLCSLHWPSAHKFSCLHFLSSGVTGVCCWDQHSFNWICRLSSFNLYFCVVFFLIKLFTWIFIFKRPNLLKSFIRKWFKIHAHILIPWLEAWSVPFLNGESIYRAFRYWKSFPDFCCILLWSPRIRAYNIQHNFLILWTNYSHQTFNRMET